MWDEAVRALCRPFAHIWGSGILEDYCKIFEFFVLLLLARLYN